MVKNMKVTFKKIKKKDKEYKYIVMEINMLELGEIIKDMVKEY